MSHLPTPISAKVAKGLEYAETYKRTGSLRLTAREHGVSMSACRARLIDAGVEMRTGRGQTLEERAARAALKKMDSGPKAPAREGRLNLHVLSGGACTTLPGPCEFASCRYRANEAGDCAIRLANEGARGDTAVGEVLGLSRQAVDTTLARALIKLRMRPSMRRWAGHETTSEGHALGAQAEVI